MPAFTIGEDITATLSHYADGDVGDLEFRLVDLGTGDPVIDWATTGIVQTSDPDEGPDWIYTATRDSDAIVAYWVALYAGEDDPNALGRAAALAGVYQAQWQLPPSAGPWSDTDDPFTLTEAFTGSDLDLFRLLLDDLDGALFTDAQVAVLLARHPTDVRLAVAEAAGILALRFSNGIKVFKVNDKSFERWPRAAAYAALAARMLADIAAENGGVTSAYMTRIDGNSDDISAEDANAYGTLDGTGRVGWRFANVHGDEPIWMPE